MLDDHPILHVDLTIVALIPQLWNLQALVGPAFGWKFHRLRYESWCLRRIDPRLLEVHTAVDKVLREDCRFRKLAQVEDHAFPLRDQIEIVSKCLRIPLEWVVRPSDFRVLQLPMSIHVLLPSLDAHSDMRYNYMVLGEIYVGLPHHEPFSGIPLLIVILLEREVETTLHADDRLLVLAHGEFFQVVIGLEEHVAHTCAHQPIGLETLYLHRVVFFVVRWVQREEGFTVLHAPHLKRDRKVLQVHRPCWLKRRNDTGCAYVLWDPQAYHTLRLEKAAHLLCNTNVAGYTRNLPADIVLLTARALQLSLFFPAPLVLPLQEDEL